MDDTELRNRLDSVLREQIAYVTLNWGGQRLGALSVDNSIQAAIEALSAEVSTVRKVAEASTLTCICIGLGGPEGSDDAGDLWDEYKIPHTREQELAE